MLARLSRLLGRQKGEHHETTGRQKEAGLQPQCRTSRHKWFWAKRRSTGKTSTPNSVTEQEQQMNKVDTLTLQLQMMTQERNELHGIPANSTNKDLNNSILHNQLLSERTQLKQKVSMLREENRKLWRDQISLQESCEKVKNLCDEAHEKIYELCAKEKQKQEKLEERLQYLLKQRDLVTKQIVLVKELQNHFAVSQMSSASEN